MLISVAYDDGYLENSLPLIEATQKMSIQSNI